jgi:hypothetical protein
MEKFWLVWGEGRGNPTRKHLTATEAEAEAHRLAENCPGVKFHVLQSTLSLEGKTQVDVTRHDEKTEWHSWPQSVPNHTQVCDIIFKDNSVLENANFQRIPFNSWPGHFECDNHGCFSACVAAWRPAQFKD